MKFVRQHSRVGVNQRRSLTLWIASVLSCALGIVPFGARPSVEAAIQAPQIQMTTVVGFSSWYGRNHWVPVTVTLHNPGKAVSANLVLDTDYSLTNGRNASGTMYWPVRVPANSDKSIQIAVTGEMIETNDALECQVNHHVVGQTRLLGNPLRNVSLVAVLSSQPQDMQFLMGSAAATGEPVLPVAVNPSTLPTSPSLYNNLTAVVATPETLNRFVTDQQQQALISWVKLGGLLIVTGTTGTSDWWSQKLPFYPGPARIQSGKPLTVFISANSGGPQIRVTTFEGGLRPGAVAWAPTDSKAPLIAAIQFGRGKIVQTAFEPAQEPSLLSWPSNATLWTTILKQGSSGSMSALPGLLDPSVLNLATAANTLSPMRVPSLGFWATVFALYTLVVGPVLFIVLRRTKRESLGWVVIPALSFVTTIGIWAFGASQRPSGSLLAGVGVEDLIGDSSGGAEAYGIQGFMSPLSQNTAVAYTSQPMMMLPLSESTDLTGESDAKVIQASNHSTVEFSNVGRWRVRYIYAAGAVHHQGRIHATLQSSFGMVSGVIRNETPYHLHNVSMFWNGHMFMLGDLVPGASSTITADTPTEPAPTDWLSLYTSYNRDITRGVGHALGSFAASQNLMNLDLADNQALFVATTTDISTPGLPVLHERTSKTTRQTMVLMRQFANVTVYNTGVIS